MLKKSRRRKDYNLPTCSIVLAVLISITSFVGCGGNPNLAEVRGVVTLDGKPLPDAFIVFSPESELGGATSYGKTDAQGKYRMKFSDTQSGAWIGVNQVAIRTGDVKPDNSGSTPELVPTAYNSKTRLTADVKKGRNTYDFELKSDVSPIEQVEDDTD